MKAYIGPSIIASALIVLIACLFAMVNADDTASNPDPITDLALLADESNDNLAIIEPEASTDVINNLNLIISDKNIINAENDEMKSQITIAETGLPLLELISDQNGIGIESIQKDPGDSLPDAFSSGYDADIGIISPAESTMICDQSTGICRFVSQYSI